MLYPALTITTPASCERRLLFVKVKDWADLFPFSCPECGYSLHSPISKGPGGQI